MEELQLEIKTVTSDIKESLEILGVKFTVFKREVKVIIESLLVVSELLTRIRVSTNVDTHVDSTQDIEQTLLKNKIKIKVSNMMNPSFLAAQHSHIYEEIVGKITVLKEHVNSVVM